MSFDLSSASGLESFNKFLLDNSYAAGWVPSQADVALFKALAAAPDGKDFLHFIISTSSLFHLTNLLLLHV